jgi:hypothetical protein
MNTDHVDAILEGIAPVVVGLIEREVAARIAAIPPAARGEPGQKGDPGKSVTLEEVQTAILEAVGKAVASIPAPKDGTAGKDAEPIDVDAVVAMVLAKMPVPRDGKDADPEQIRAEAVNAAKLWGELHPPEDGRSVTLEDVRPMIESAVAAAVSAIPAPKSGEPGQKGDPGKDAAPVDVAAILADVIARIPPPVPGKDADPAQIAALVDQAVAAIPRPKDGSSVTIDDVSPLVERAIAAAVAAIPKPKDGEPGRSFTIEDARALLEGKLSEWALDFERRAQTLFQGAIDKMPKPRDGTDGFGFDDLSVAHDGDGNVTLRFARGDQVKEFALRLPRFKDKGVFREGEAYREGDGVTFGGSFSIAQKDNPQGRPGESDDWRLAVRKGRDGKDLRPPELGDPVVRLK